MQIIAIVQARRGSTRLPDKVIRKISGKPMLYHVLERVGRTKSVSRIYLATTTDRRDRILAGISSELGVKTFFGSEKDVLDRYYQAAKKFRAAHIVRITADCPLVDPDIIDRVVAMYVRGKYDYVSNVLEPTFPDGLDVEVFSFEALERAWREAKLASEREHVTPYIWKNHSVFRIGSIKNDRNLSGHRWTVDDAKDLAFIRRIYMHLHHKDPRFGYTEVLSLLEKRADVFFGDTKRNEGYEKSLREDEIL